MGYVATEGERWFDRAYFRSRGPFHVSVPETFVAFLLSIPQCGPLRQSCQP